MSVEKFIVTKEDSGYTTLPNHVLQNLKNLEALGLWCYFQSKPPQWEFDKKEIRKIFNIGIHKLENICNVLKNHCLIEINQERNKKGCFSYWHLHVKNGAHYKPLSRNCIAVKTQEKHRSPENRATDNRATVNSTHRKDISNKNKKEENKDKSFCEDRKKANEEKHSFASMMNETASIKKNREFKRCPPPKEFADLRKKIKIGAL